MKKIFIIIIIFLISFFILRLTSLDSFHINYKGSYNFPLILSIILITIDISAIIYILINSFQNKPQNSEIKSLEACFKEAKNQYNIYLGNKNSFLNFHKKKYEKPWYIFIGDNSILNNNDCSPLDLTINHIKDGECNWYFFSDAILLNPLYEICNHEDDTKWKVFLKLLRKARFKRPIDGVILSIKYNDLINNNHESTDKSSNITAKNLNTTIKNLNLEYPIYFIVSQCENINGFNGFASNISNKDQAFGFLCNKSHNCENENKFLKNQLLKNKYFTFLENSSLDLYQFCEKLNLEELNFNSIAPQNDQFKKPKKDNETDDKAKESYTSAIKKYYNKIFSDKRLIFRGIFYSGIYNQQAIFIKDLFNTIAKERNIAKPVISKWLNKKYYSMISISFLFLIIVLTPCYYNYYYKSPTRLSGILSSIKMGKQYIYDNKVDKQDYSKYKDNLIYLLQNLPDLKELRINFIWPKWFNTNEIINTSFHDVIIKSFRIELDSYVTKLVNYSLQNERHLEDTNKFSKEWLKSLPEYEQLDKYISEIEKLENNIIRYNGMSKNNYGLFFLIRDYIKDMYNHEILIDNRNFYQKDILDIINRNVTLYKLSDQKKEKIINQLIKIVKLFSQKVHKDRDVYLNNLVNSLNELSSNNDLLKFDQINKIIKNINEAEKLISFYYDASPDKNSLYTDLLARIRKLNMIKTSNAVDVIKIQDHIWKKDYEDLINKLLKKESYILGNRIYLVTEKKLTRNIIDLKNALESITKLSFINNVVGSQNASLEDTYVDIFYSDFQWEMQEIKKAIKICDEFDRFIKIHKDKPLFESYPASLRTNVMTAIKNRVEKIINSLLRQSVKQSESNKILNDKIDHFANIKNQLKELGLKIKQLRIYSSIYNVLIINHMEHLLKQYQSQLDKENLFLPLHHINWDGKDPSAFFLFRVHNDKELEIRLNRDFKRIEYFLRILNPLITFFNAEEDLNGLGLDAESLLFWIELNNIVENVTKANSGNSYYSLIDFILYEMNSITINNFFDKISCKELLETGDFFIQRKAIIKKILYNKCYSLVTSNVFNSYKNLYDTFNDKLKGKFPFIDLKGNFLNSESVEIDDLKYFYKIFKENYTEELVNILSNHNNSNKKSNDVIQFLQQMQQVLIFFEPFINEQKAHFKISGVFKPESKKEEQKLNKHIIETFIDIDNESIGENTFFSGKWKYNNKIELTIRWAKDGIYYPITEKKGNWLYTLNKKNKSINYNFSDYWALLKFIAKYNTSEYNNCILKFEIPTKNMKNNKDYSTIFFISLNIHDPKDENKIISIPDFPIKAPKIRDIDDLFKNNRSLCE